LPDPIASFYGNYQIMFIQTESSVNQDSEFVKRYVTRYTLIMTTTTENMELDSMFDPPHPGEILREDVFPEMGLTVTEAASQIGVSRVTLSRMLNGRAAISPDMALRLEAWLGVENGGRAETWLTHQLVYDLWRARQKVA
jgi:addiction module HigA family antidote